MKPLKVILSGGGTGGHHEESRRSLREDARGFAASVRRHHEAARSGAVAAAGSRAPLSPGDREGLAVVAPVPDAHLRRGSGRSAAAPVRTA